MIATDYIFADKYGSQVPVQFNLKMQGLPFASLQEVQSYTWAGASSYWEGLIINDFLREADGTIYLSWQNCPYFPKFQANEGVTVTYLEDLTGFVETIFANQFQSYNALTTVIAPLATVVENGAFTATGLKLINLPKVTQMGSSVLNNGVFGSMNNSFIYVNGLLATANNGSPDGDIQQLINTASNSVNYVLEAKPDPITDLYVIQTLPISAQLGFTFIPGCSKYRVYINEVFFKEFISPGDFVSGFTPGQIITGITVRGVYNFNDETEDSNIVSFTTAETDMLVDGLEGYFNLNELSGTPVYDLVNGRDGFSRGQVTKNSQGIVNTGYYFQNGVLKLPAKNVKSISMWVKRIASLNGTNSYLMDARTGATAYIVLNTSAGFNRMVVNGVDTVVRGSSLPLNTWAHCYLQFTNIYVNGTITMFSVYVRDTENIESNADEIAFFNKDLTNNEIAYLINNGNGRTL